MTGTFAANRIAADADVVIGIGTRWSDFTTASKTSFRNPDVRFVNVNVADFDAAKLDGVALVADARVTLERLAAALEGYQVEPEYRERVARLNREWDEEVDAAVRARSQAAARSERSDRRGQRCSATDGRGGLRRRIDARRPAQALAHAGPEGLPRRVRVLVHGLRDRRRPGREDGRARARGVRHGRRRLLPDALERDRHLDPGRPEADDRARRQPRLQLDRKPLPLARHGRLRDAVPLQAERLARSGQRRSDGAAAAGRSRRECRVARREGDPVSNDRRASEWARGREGRGLRRSCSRSRSIATREFRATRAGGTFRSPRSRRSRPSRRHARSTSELELRPRGSSVSSVGPSNCRGS